MYFLSQTKLERSLARGELDSWEKTRYFLVPLVVSYLTPFSQFLPGWQVDKPRSVVLIGACAGLISAFIAYHGIRKCFAANKLIGGDHFIERFTILTFPITVKFVVVLTVLVILFFRFSKQWIGYGIVFSGISPLLTWVFFFMAHRTFLRFAIETESFQAEQRAALNSPPARE